VKDHAQVSQKLRELPEPLSTVVAVDAPLTSKPSPKYRPLDRDLYRILRPYRIGVLPPKFLEIREVLQTFQTLRFPLYPWPLQTVPGVFEVYPQAIAVALWRHALTYKRRSLRAEERRAALREIRASLAAILSSRFKLSRNLVDWLLHPVSHRPLRQWIDETDAFLCVLPLLWLHAGLGIRTIPRQPKKGHPYLLTLWEDV